MWSWCQNTNRNGKRRFLEKQAKSTNLVLLSYTIINFTDERTVILFFSYSVAKLRDALDVAVSLLLLPTTLKYSLLRHRIVTLPHLFTILLAVRILGSVFVLFLFLIDSCLWQTHGGRIHSVALGCMIGKCLACILTFNNLNLDLLLKSLGSWHVIPATAHVFQ